MRTPLWNRCRRNAPHELRQHDQAENPRILFGSEPVGANHDPGIEFAPDSPLEGAVHCELVSEVKIPAPVTKLGADSGRVMG